MADEDAIPTSYQQWRYFIEERGGMRLTSSYVGERLSASLRCAADELSEDLGKSVLWARSDA